MKKERAKQAAAHEQQMQRVERQLEEAEAARQAAAEAKPEVRQGS